MSRVQALTGKAIETLGELLGEKDHPAGCGPHATRPGPAHSPSRVATRARE